MQLQINKITVSMQGAEPAEINLDDCIVPIDPAAPVGFQLYLDACQGGEALAAAERQVRIVEEAENAMGLFDMALQLQGGWENGPWFVLPTQLQSMRVDFTWMEMGTPLTHPESEIPVPQWASERAEQPYVPEWAEPVKRAKR